MRLLRKASQTGVDVTVITRNIGNSFGKKETRSLTRQVNSKFKIIEKPFYTHEKMLIFGDEEVFIGSHNFAQFLVRTGTSEVALLSRDKELVHAISNYFSQLEKKQSID